MEKIYIIKEEPHPLKPSSSVYRAYFEDGTPYHIGRETLGELIDYMHQMHPELSFRSDDGESTTHISGWLGKSFGGENV